MLPHKRRLYTWTSPDSQHQNQIDYILCSQRWRSSIQSAKSRPGADCGADHELLITKVRLILKKVEKTTRPFSYDLNPDNLTTRITVSQNHQDTLSTPLPQFYVLRGTSHCLKLIIRKGSIRPMRERGLVSLACHWILRIENTPWHKQAFLSYWLDEYRAVF